MRRVAATVLAVFALTAAGGAGVAPAIAAPTPADAYMARVSKECRRLTSESIAHTRAYVRAKKTGDRQTAGKEFSLLVLGVGEAAIRILNLDVPEAVAPRMRLVRANLLLQMQTIQRLTKTTEKTELGRLFDRLDALGTQSDVLFDRVGLLDCGSRASDAVTRAAGGG